MVEIDVFGNVIEEPREVLREVVSAKAKPVIEEYIKPVQPIVTEEVEDGTVVAEEPKKKTVKKKKVVNE